MKHSEGVANPTSCLLRQLTRVGVVSLYMHGHQASIFVMYQIARALVGCTTVELISPVEVFLLRSQCGALS